jgi:hypothetical protein
MLSGENPQTVLKDLIGPQQQRGRDREAESCGGSLQGVARWVRSSIACSCGLQLLYEHPYRGGRNEQTSA